MMRVGRAGEESESEESEGQERETVMTDGPVFGDEGVFGGEAVGDVRGELGVCTLLLVLSGVGVVGLRDRLGEGRKKNGTMQVAVQLRGKNQRWALGIGRAEALCIGAGNPEGVTRPGTEAKTEVS
jgi:hypothetical protein